MGVVFRVGMGEEIALWRGKGMAADNRALSGRHLGLPRLFFSQVGGCWGGEGIDGYVELVARAAFLAGAYWVGEGEWWLVYWQPGRLKNRPFYGGF